MSGKAWRSVGKWVARLVTAAVLALVVGALVVLIVLPRATQGQALTVLSGSMTPKIPVGSVVVIVPVDPATLRVGDVATYQTEPGKAEYITHRIVAIDRSTEPAKFTFKGDANPGPDIDPVPAGAIRGKVWFHVPYLGYIRNSLQTVGGMATAGVALLGCYALYQLYGALRDRKRRKMDQAQQDVKAATPAPADDSADVLISASFRPATLRGLTPQGFASAVHGAVLESKTEHGTCSIAVIVAAERADDMAGLLSTFEPVSMDISDMRADEPTMLIPAQRLSAAGRHHG